MLTQVFFFFFFFFMQRAGADESLGANDGTTVFNLKSVAPNRSSVVVEHGLPDTCEEIVCADGAPGTLTNLLERSHNVPAQHVGLDLPNQTSRHPHLRRPTVLQTATPPKLPNKLSTL